MLCHSFSTKLFSSQICIVYPSFVSQRPLHIERRRDGGTQTADLIGGGCLKHNTLERRSFWSCQQSTHHWAHRTAKRVDGCSPLGGLGGGCACGHVAAINPSLIRMWLSRMHLSSISFAISRTQRASALLSYEKWCCNSFCLQRPLHIERRRDGGTQTAGDLLQGGMLLYQFMAMKGSLF